jgi:hypothetical protein
VAVEDAQFNQEHSAAQLEILMAEYQKLKDEQTHRIGFRDNLIYVTTAAIGAVLSFSISGSDRRAAVLVLPPLCFALGWTYVMNDLKVSAIGRYIREHLRSKLENLAAASGGLLEWEAYHRADGERVSRKFLQLVVDEVLFTVTPIVAVGWYAAIAGPDAAIVALLTLEAALMAILAWQIIIYSDLFLATRGRTHRP